MTKRMPRVLECKKEEGYAIYKANAQPLRANKPHLRITIPASVIYELEIEHGEQIQVTIQKLSNSSAPHKRTEKE